MLKTWLAPPKTIAADVLILLTPFLSGERETTVAVFALRNDPDKVPTGLARRPRDDSFRERVGARFTRVPSLDAAED